MWGYVVYEVWKILEEEGLSILSTSLCTRRPFFFWFDEILPVVLVYAAIEPLT